MPDCPKCSVLFSEFGLSVLLGHSCIKRNLYKVQSPTFGLVWVANDTCKVSRIKLQVPERSIGKPTYEKVVRFEECPEEIMGIFSRQ